MHSTVATPFKLSKQFLTQYKGKQPAWGFEGLGYVVYKRSYARPLSDEPDAPLEEYWQTCQRVIEGAFTIQKRHIATLGTRWDDAKAQRSAQEMFKLMWAFKFLPPGRGLWAMGSKIVMDMGNGAPCYNCATRTTRDIDVDFTAPFCFLLEASALGIGVGFDTLGASKVAIVEPARSDDIHVIDDSREGWSEALRTVLSAYIGEGNLPRLDYSQVRPFGAPIKTFGGTASGPEALQELLESDIPCALEKKGPISSGQIVDIMNAIGKCVVAGGTRRSSEVALGEIDDEEFINLKNDDEKLRRWRWASNNSVKVPRGFRGFERFTPNVTTRGEPGFIFLDNGRAYGRMTDPETWDDSLACGANPCLEIIQEDGELCNIAELFPAHCDSLEDFKRALKYAYLYSKTVTLLKTPWERTNAVMLRNRRIGLSVSGIVQNIAKRGHAEHIRWLDEGYKYLGELDKLYSDWFCIPRSKKKTAIKPSGSVSLLAGATAGIHYPHSRFYIRRVTFSLGSPILETLKAAGYETEVSVYDSSGRTIKVLFPIEEKDFGRAKDEVSMWEQMENAAQHQAYWADNAVSITVTIKPHEFADMAPALERYQTRLKCVSFLPLAADYAEAPYETISEERYALMKSKVRPFSLSDGVQHEVTERFCDGETCLLSIA